MSLQVKSCHRYIGLAEPRSHVYAAAAREAGKKVLASTLRRHRLKWGKSLHTERVFKYIEEIQRRMINLHYTGVQLKSLLTWETFSKTTARIKVSLFCLSVICYLHIYWVIIITDVIHIPISPPSCVSLPPSLSYPSRWSQSTELISLCYVAASN